MGIGGPVRPHPRFASVSSYIGCRFVLQDTDISPTHVVMTAAYWSGYGLATLANWISPEGPCGWMRTWAIEALLAFLCASKDIADRRFPRRRLVRADQRRMRSLSTDSGESVSTGPLPVGEDSVCPSLPLHGRRRNHWP